MVTYDREFLVPYLKNLCALYYAKRKLEIERDKTIRARNNNQNPLPHQAPPLPPSIENAASTPNLDLGETVKGCFGVLLLFLGTAFIFGGGMNGVSSFVKTVGISIGIIAVILLLLLPVLISSKKSEDRANEEEYQRRYEAYRKANAEIDAENKLRENRYVKYDMQQKQMLSELQQINNLINRAYDANIIPGNYREMYCVVYLYDYFSKSRSNDMDIALNTYVLEQIKAKLDIIIQNQSEMLLNQELMLANQERALDERREHHKRLESKIDRMNCELEEANQYRQVIHSDLETLEFFARDNYIRRICS